MTTTRRTWLAAAGASLADVPTWVMAAVAAVGTSRAFTPEAVAMPQSPAAMPRAARWYATREEEQAVLVGTQGPTRPRV